MYYVAEILLNLYFWIISIVSLLVTFIVCCISYPFVQQKTISRLYEAIPGYIVFYCMTIPGFWKVNIHDFRKDKSWSLKNNYVIIGNHISYSDSLFMAIAVPLKKKFMIGEIFTKIPVFGWLSIMSGHVPVDRNNKQLCSTAVDRSVKNINLDNSSFCIYPEGMRAKTPYIFEKFKTGAYRIAFNTGLPILPVTLINTHKVMTFKGWIKFGEVHICIDEPFKIFNDNYSSYITKSKRIFTERIMQFA